MSKRSSFNRFQMLVTIHFSFFREITAQIHILDGHSIPFSYLTVRTATRVRKASPSTSPVTFASVLSFAGISFLASVLVTIFSVVVLTVVVDFGRTTSSKSSVS